MIGREFYTQRFHMIMIAYPSSVFCTALTELDNVFLYLSNTLLE